MGRRCGMWRSAICALALLLAGAAPAAADRTLPGRPLEIVSPRDTKFVTKGVVTIRVRAAGRLRSLRATVDGRRVRLRRRHGVHVAHVPVRRLHRGRNSFDVSAVGSRRRTLKARVTLIRARRQRSLARLEVRRRDGRPLVATLHPRRRHVRLRSLINGRRVERLFAPPRHGERTASLSASDGLRFGRNRLTVLVFRDDGDYARLTRTVRVPRTAPLAGAGRDRAALVGHTTRVDARSSRAGDRRHRLRYRWRIVGAPKGSAARLKGARSARPSLRPDRRGLYKLRLVVSEVPRRRSARAAATAGSATDTVLVAAQDPVLPTGFPMSIDRSRIQIQGLPAIDLSSLDGYIVVVLDRASVAGGTVHVVAQDAWRYGEEQQLRAFLEKRAASELVILVTATPPTGDLTMGGLTSDPSDLQAALARIGAAPLKLHELPDGTQWGVPASIVVGIPGTAVGQAYEDVVPWAAEGTLSMSGAFTRDSTTDDPLLAGYTFAPTEYVPFSLSSSTGAIQLGCTRQTSYCHNISPAVPTPGFVVAVVNAYTLQPTASQGFGTDPGSLQAMADFIGQYSGDPGHLFVVASVGGPSPANTSWQSVTEEIQGIGGNFNIFNTFNPPNLLSGPGNYALIGGSGIDAREEAGGTTTTPLEMHGVLWRDTNWRFAPMLTAPLADYTTDLITTAFQPGQPWPDSGGDFPAIEAYIAGLFCVEPSQDPCKDQPRDIRSRYWLRDDIQWGDDMGPRLAHLHYPTHVLTVGGSPSGGSFTVSWNGRTTAPIEVGATANQVQYALYQLDIDSELQNVRVEGGPGSGLPSNEYLLDMTAAGTGTLTANGSGLTPSGQVTVTACAPADQDCAGFTRADYATMKTFLIQTEWPAVDRLGDFMGFLDELYNSSGSALAVDVQGISSNIQQQIGTHDLSLFDKIFATVQNCLSFAGSIAGFFSVSPHGPGGAQPWRAPSRHRHVARAADDPSPTPGAQTAGALGMVSAAFGIASIWTTDDSGNRTMQQLQTSTTQLATEAGQAASDSSLGLERLRELLVSDYGKLSTAVDLIDENGVTTDATVQEAVSDALQVAWRRNAYDTLMPVVYQYLFCGESSKTPPGWLSATVDFAGGPFQVLPVTKVFGNGASTSLLTAISGQPTFGKGGNLDAGEDLSRFWVDTMGAGVRACTP